MNILVTGARGFIGRNLIAELHNRGHRSVFAYDVDTRVDLLDEYCRQADFVFHLAGVNRPVDAAEFMAGNFGFTATLLSKLKEHHNTCPVVVSSSIQAASDNPYGRSKKAAEDMVFAYGREVGARVLIYRLPNVFGKWCRPNYNSVVATWCHAYARGLPIQVNDPATVLNLVYIDDVVNEFIAAMQGNPTTGGDGFARVPRDFRISLGELAGQLCTFSESRKTLVMPNFESDLTRFLYATYLSYLPEEAFTYALNTKRDNRGCLAEFIKSQQLGQIFVSRTHPGVTRGNHWHHTKIEKFLVLEGEALIRFRQVATDTVLEYKVSGDTWQVVDIPAGYTHSITNIGDKDVITLFWATEMFRPEHPDTYYLEV